MNRPEWFLCIARQGDRRHANYHGDKNRYSLYHYFSLLLQKQIYGSEPGKIMPVNAYRNYLFGALTGSLMAAGAHAENEDAIAQCARIASPGERILCLENALRGETAAPANDENPVPGAESVQDVAPTAEQTMPAEEKIEVAADARETEVEQFGLAEEEKNPDPVTSVDVVVVKLSKTAYGKQIYTTDNGQVWMQTDKKSVRYRQLPIDMTIRDGASGSYFIQPRSGGVAVRVKRRQ